MAIASYDLNILVNQCRHHTGLFGGGRLVIRRGQPFHIHLRLSPVKQAPRLTEASLKFTVETGPSPRIESGTKASFGPCHSIDDSEWCASATVDPPGQTVCVSINSPPDAPIGVYSLTLDYEGKRTSLGQFILLFNPWCSRDAVHMHSETERQEYVLSQHGLIFRSSEHGPIGAPWNFQQFEDGILDICLKILDQNPKCACDAAKDHSARRSPIYVTRVLSAMINTNEDNGVLVGKWGTITDGVHPGEWIGSADILRRWARSGPVCYGQCWVFAAVACTVSRALGIPCRVVTNYNSAHDTNGNLLIEMNYNAQGGIQGGESIWNFHVWVDSWMTRPDLGTEYDGWQASDPTPQEKSEGVYCCGPASVKAIKEGKLDKKYDLPFIFAEVNADVVKFMQQPDGKFLEVISTTHVGKFISTKAIGADHRQDITHEYKYPEGSKDERRVFESTQHPSKLQQREEDPGLRLEIKLSNNMMVGSNFEVFAVLSNTSMDARTYTFLFFAKAVGYTGKVLGNCGFATDTVKVLSGQEKRLALKLEYGVYGAMISSDRLIQLSVFAVDQQSLKAYGVEKTIGLGEPKLKMKLVGDATVKRPMRVELTLLNPLPEPLEDCTFTIEGSGLTGGKQITHRIGVLGPNEKAKANVQFSPTTANSSELLASFKSNKLKSIKNFVRVVVTH